MTLFEIVDKINQVSMSGNHPFGQLQSMRGQAYNNRPRTKKPFARFSTIPDEGYAYHAGGMTELQFNIGNRLATGINKFRYGIAFSFQATQSEPDPVTKLKPIVTRFNQFLNNNPVFFNGCEMWLYDGAKNSLYSKKVISIGDDLIKNGHFIFIGKFIDKRQEDVNVSDIESIVKEFDYLFSAYKTIQFGEKGNNFPATFPINFTEESSTEQIDLNTKEGNIPLSEKNYEKRIARICWNTNGWKNPSGATGKSTSQDAHEAQYGFGHEEWLFDTKKTIDGYHYAFLEPVNKKFSAYADRQYDVFLYTIENVRGKRTWYFVGRIEKLEVLTLNQAKEAYSQYKKNGWLNEMKKQLTSPIYFSQWKDNNLFNVRFHSRDLKKNKKLIKAPQLANFKGLSRYVFAHYRKEHGLEKLQDIENLYTGTGIKPTREAKIPCLDAEKYATALTKLFLSAKEDFSFALFGKWGRGKTYQMKLVADKLKKEHNYEVINFSAWKYRTNPSLWVHLYENFVDKINEQGMVSRFLTYFRIGICKHGWWSLCWIYLSLFLGLLSIDNNMTITSWIFRAIGAGGVLFLFRFWSAGRKIGPKYIEKYGSVPNFKEKLGLQETVGSNLKYLIQGWTYTGLWKPEHFLPLVLSNLFLCANIIVILINIIDINLKLQYLTVLITWGWLISLFIFIFLIVIEILYIKDIKEVNKKDDEENAGFKKDYVKKIWNSFMGLITSPPHPDKILLIVDDLDRCEMSEMLCVIESIILLLDEDDLKKKLQIAMLVEEEAVRLAIGHKYIEMIRSRNFKKIPSEKDNIPSTDTTHPHELNKELYSKMGSEVINENIEKLFLFTLKLGNLTPPEKQEAMLNFLKENSDNLENINKKNQDEVSNIPDDSETFLTDENGNFLTDKNGAKLIVENTNEDIEENVEIDTEITQNERNALMSLIADWEKDDEEKWGPRALRALKFKYLFARLLLKEFEGEVDFTHFMNVFKEELEKQSEGIEANSDTDDIYRKIVQQVI